MGGRLQAVEETAASGGEVEAGGPGVAQAGLEEAGGGGEGLVRGEGPEDDQVEIGGVNPGPGQGRAGRLLGHEGDRLLAAGDPALADPRPFQDPLVAGLDHLLQVGIGQNAAGEIAARGRDPDRTVVHDTSFFHTAARASWIFALTALFSNLSATSRALPIALGGELPWQMMQVCFTPRSGAPPYSL